MPILVMTFALYTVHYVVYTRYDYMFQIIYIMTEYSFLKNNVVKYCMIIHLYSWMKKM